MGKIHVIQFWTACLLGMFMLHSCQSTTQNQTESASQSQTSDSLPTSRSSGGENDSTGNTILVLGNSIAAGYGLQLEQSFPSLLQNRIDSLGLDYQVVNAGLSGETTTAGVNRLPWLLRQPVDILIIELGGNDGLRGIDPSVTEQNLLKMIDLARAKYPQIEIILCGMLAPPNMGPAYTEPFQAVFDKVADEKQTLLVPFILEGVAGIPGLNQEDGIHPTPAGQVIVADNVWQILAPLLGKS